MVESARPRALPVIGGVLLILSGFLLRAPAVATALVADGEIHGTLNLRLILAARILLILAGAWLLIARRVPLLPPGGMQALPAVAGAACAVFGAWINARHLEWLQPRIRPPGELCAWLTDSRVPYLGTVKLEMYRERVREAEERSAPAEEVVRLRLKLADHLLRDGQVEEAIRLLEETKAFALSRGTPVEVVNSVRRWLGIAHLRSGELQHCVQSTNSAKCLFPVREGGVWANPEPARLAMANFTEYLTAVPDDADVKWLLNIACMSAGLYPDGVPPAFLIPPEVFASSETSPRFREVGVQAGVSPQRLAGGSVIEDFDNDGFLDIVVTSNEPCASMRFYHSSGDGTFEDWSERSGLSSQTGGFDANQTDYNNDGRPDLLVVRGAWLRNWGRQRNSLLRQNPDGTFTDVTDEAGMGDVAYPDITADWGDYDNDGDLDVYVGGEALTAATFSPSQLYRNNGDGTFTNVSRAAGVLNWRNAKGVSWGDYDNDGDSDLYVSNMGQPNRLYRNNGDGTFTDVGPELGVALMPPGNNTFGTWFFDVNNDGWLDLYVSGYAPVLEDGVIGLRRVAADYLGAPPAVETLNLFLNDGTGRFRDVTAAYGLKHVRVPMGGNYGDVDNDGFPDIYLGTGGPPFAVLVPNILYRNIGGERFADVTTAAGVGHLQKGHGVAFGDLDNDGDQDLYAQLGGMYKNDPFPAALFENLGTPNHWLTVRLVGVRSNRLGIGSRLRVTVEEKGRERQIRTVAGSGGSFGASSVQQEIGLGTAERVKELEIFWPASGTRQVLESPPMDRFIEVTEGAPGFRVLERRVVRLGGGSRSADGGAGSSY